MSYRPGGERADSTRSAPACRISCRTPTRKPKHGHSVVFGNTTLNRLMEEGGSFFYSVSTSTQACVAPIQWANMVFEQYHTVQAAGHARSCLPNTEVIQEVHHPCQRACPAAAERGKFDTVCVRPLPGRSTVCADPGSGLTAHVTIPALTGPSLNVQHVPGAPWREARGAVVVHHGLLLCPLVSRSFGRTGKFYV